MSVIAISRGTFSGGKKLAEALARRLDYRCIDRDAVVQRTSIRSVSPTELFSALDLPPSSDLCTLNHRKYIYLALLKAAVADEAASGNAVYHGLVGHLLFPDDLPILGIRVIAPMEYRLQEAQQRMQLNHDQAAAHIAKVDEHRAKWTRYLYGVNWEDPSLYDLVLNLQNFNIDQACHWIGGMIKQGAFAFSARHQTIMKDFVLAAHVRAALAKDIMTTHLEVEVESRAGLVTIKGDLFDQTEDVQRVAASVAGVQSVILEQPDVAHES